jgi:holin-like protein
LTYISAFVEIVVGVLVILLRYAPDISDDLKRFVTLAGAAGILIGFLTVAVASGIARGDRSARIVLTVLLAIGAALSIASAITDASDLPFSVANALVSAGLIVVLWTGRTRAYFARASA